MVSYLLPTETWLRRPSHRSVCGLFADRDVQDFLFAIYALYHELATTPSRTQEFRIGEIDFQWRRGTLLLLKLEVNFSKNSMI